MATEPIFCPPDDGDGFIFDGTDLIKESPTSQIFDLSLFNMEISSYAKTKYKLGPGKSLLLAQSDVGDADGYVRFIAFTVKYPEGTTTVEKYLNWTYEGNTNPIGELMILSGDRIDSDSNPTVGWDLSYDSGIVIENPHSELIVEIEILIAR